MTYEATFTHVVVAAAGRRGGRRLTTLDRHTGRPSMYSESFETQVRTMRRNMRSWLAQGRGGFYVVRYW